MTRRFTPSLAAALFVAGAASAQQPSPSTTPQSPVAQQAVTPPPTRAAALTADTPTRTAGGAAFVAPKGWSLASADSTVTIIAPEGDTRVVIVDVGAAADAAAATAHAWRVSRSDFRRTVKLVAALPAREGWDEQETVTYDIAPSEMVNAIAYARRSGAQWTVVLLDGSNATLGKRLAATNLLIASLRPAGYRRESFAGRTPHPLDAARIDSLKAFVQTAMQELGIPGVGLALVDHGRVVYEGGLGERELGRPEPVDAHTLFMIASNTKGMSTLLLARLVDEGKLAWEQPVTQVYPAFRLGSDATTRSVLVRHLVCACTGLPRKDFTLIFGTTRSTPASATFDQLAATQPTSGFGEVYQYNNLMASAAGYIGAHLVYPDRELGDAYDLAMQRLIFEPLGMRETTFDMQRALAANHASPHDWDVDGRTGLASIDANYAFLPYRPAGGAWSSAHDLIKYVQLELAQGRLPDGRQLVSARNLLLRRAPSVPTGEDASYGMGLMEEHVLGVEVVHHGGSLFGYKSDWVAVPEAGVGAVLLTNGDQGRRLLDPFRRRLLELLYGGRAQAAGDVTASAASALATLAKERPKLMLPAAPATAKSLAAYYLQPDLGHIDVRRVGADIVFDFGVWRSRVASRANEDGTVAFVLVDPTTRGLAFVAGSRNGKRTLTLREAQHEYVYIEAP